MHKGARSIGGNMSIEFQNKVNKLLDQFGILVQEITIGINHKIGEVRSLLSCSLVIVLDKNKLFIIAQHHLGTPSTLFLYDSKKEFTMEQIINSAQWEFGFNEPFFISFPNVLLDQSEEQRKLSLRSIALNHVYSEIERVNKMMNLIQITPLFGPASYTIDEKLCFVLMPFSEENTKIYKSIIKPTVEKLHLVCHRADDYKTNKIIVQDIWKAICESKVIIADLTNLNPNVMYELGIAHTVGKETVLIYQRNDGKNPEFPFDLAHIRRIEYTNDAAGGKILEDDLYKTLESVLSPIVKS